MDKSFFVLFFPLLNRVCLNYWFYKVCTPQRVYMGNENGHTFFSKKLFKK